MWYNYHVMGSGNRAPNQRREHIPDPITGVLQRQCLACAGWFPLANFYVCGGHLQSTCKPCARQQARERHAQNRERSRAAASRWKAEHPEKYKAKMLRWRAQNRERLREYQTAYNAKRAEAMREYMRTKSKTPEYLAYQREYDQRTGRSAEKMARRRALILGVTVEPIDRTAIIIRDNRTCYLCGKFLKWREVTLDHIVPLARGGAHAAANLRVACGPCNFSKQDRLLTTIPLGL